MVSFVLGSSGVFALRVGKAEGSWRIHKGAIG